jgi:hypothetical protein
VTHHEEEEEKLNGVDQKEDEKKNLKPGHRQGGQPPKKSVGRKRDAQHFSRKGQSRTQESIARMQNGKSEGDGNRADRDKEQED